jgi:hypothetical protein
MKSLFIVAAGTAALAAGSAEAASRVEIKGAIARVIVVPEQRSDVKVEISGAIGGLPALQTSTGADGRTIIDGGLGGPGGGLFGEHRIRGCTGFRHETGPFNPLSPPDSIRIRVRGHDDVMLKDAPLITIHTPLDVEVSADGAVFGAIGRGAESVRLGDAGCGDWSVGNVHGRLKASIAGSGDILAGSAGDAEASIAGSGDIRMNAVANLKASIAGSGDVIVQSVTGSIQASIAGSGDIRVKSGQVDDLHASIAGSGDVNVDAPVKTVHASIMGSGDVRVASAGSVSKSVMGSGTIYIGGVAQPRHRDHDDDDNDN